MCFMIVYVRVGQCVHVFMQWWWGDLYVYTCISRGGMPIPYAFVCMRVCFCVCFWLCVFLHGSMFRCGYLGNILVQE